MNSMVDLSSSLCERLPEGLPGWWFQTLLLFSIIYGLKNPEAIDELHHFSRLLLHHQLAKIGVANDRIVQYKPSS